MKTIVYHALSWTMMMIVSRVIGQKSKASIFDSKPIRVQDYGVPPATSTIPLYDCSGSHRAKQDIASAYEVYHDKQWYLQTCQEGLTWNQSLCRCEFPNGRPLVVQCRDYRSTSTDPTGKYEQLVNGQWIVRDCALAVAGLVWDQEACQCVWGPDSKEMVTGQGIAPCEIMLNMTFENGVKDEGKGSYVEVGRGNPVPIFAVNKRDAPDGYKAAYFSDTALNIWYFAGNEMGSSLRVEFRFKMTNDPIQREKYQIFVSNGCNISSPGYTTPSLAIGYRAADQSYLLAFETATARKAIVCTRKLGAYDWHTISLIYEDGTLLFRVDDQPCIISQDFSGNVQKTPCPLTIGADPLERESMYKGYLDNLLIARYCRRFIDTDPNGSKDKTKGPMPVETAPTVSEFAFQQVRPKSDKQSSHSVPGRKQRAVTSTKYLPELPRILTSGVERVEKGVAHGEFLEKLMGAREYTQSFLRFPRSGDESHGSFEGETSRRERGKEFIKHDTVNEQENDDDNLEKPDGESDDLDKSDVRGKQTNDYDTHVKAPEQENTGHTKSEKNAESRREFNNSGKSKRKSREKSPESDEEANQFSNTRQLSRQDNNNKKFRKVEEFNGHIQHFEPTLRNDKKYAHSYGDDASTSNAENNQEEKRHLNTQDDNESQDHHEHGISRDSGRHSNNEEQRNGWIRLEKRPGNKYDSTNTEKRRKTVTSRENRNGEDENTSRDYRKTRGKSQSVERFTKTDESEGDDRNSDRTSNSYEGNSPREVQKSDENDSNNRKVVNIRDDEDELSDGNGKHKRNKPGNNAGYRKKDASEKSNGFDGYDNEREFINGRNIGFKDYSDNPGKDDNVENYSKEKAKEEREVTDSHEDYDYTQQTKVQDHGGEKRQSDHGGEKRQSDHGGEKRQSDHGGEKRQSDHGGEKRQSDHGGEKRQSDRTNRDKTRDKGQGMKSGGRGHARGKTEQWQVYKGNRRDTVVSNFGTQENGPRESDTYSDNFEGSKKEGFDSESRRNPEPKLTRTKATRIEDKHVTLGVSKHQDVREDRIWNDDKKFDDSKEEDTHWGPNLAKSRPVRHDKGDISRLGKQQNTVETGSEKDMNFDISSMESASNLVKGRRRSGSKKKNWYDKVDEARSKQQESSSSDEQKIQIEQNQKPLSTEKAIGKENKRSGKVEIVYSDIHNLQYDDRRVTSDTSSGRSKSKNGKDDPQTFDVPGNINLGKTFRKPEAHGFIVKDYNENYEEDDESDQPPRADDTTRVLHDSTDKKAQYTKDQARVDSTSDQNLAITKNPEPIQTLKTNDQKHKNLEGFEEVKDKGEAGDQEKNTSLSPKREEREPEDVSNSHFNMPVDVTKITSSRSAHVTSNIPQDRTPGLSDPMKQSPASSETGKPLGH